MRYRLYSEHRSGRRPKADAAGTPTTGTPTPTPTPATQKADFVSGAKLRDGTDVSGSVYYAAEIAGKKAGTDTDATQAAMYDEQALDPYEVANSK